MSTQLNPCIVFVHLKTYLHYNFLPRQTKQIGASHPNFSKKQYANKCSLRTLYTLFDTVDLWLTKTNLCGCKDTQTKQDFCLNESQSCLLRLFTSETSSISRRQYHSNCDMYKLGLNYQVQILKYYTIEWHVYLCIPMIIEFLTNLYKNLAATKDRHFQQFDRNRYFKN